MRGRKPITVAVPAWERKVMQWIAQGVDLPADQVRRVRMVLAVADGERTADVARRLGCAASTVWRACRRYSCLGLSGLLANERNHEGNDGKAAVNGRAG